MNSLTTLLLILTPMFLGFALPVNTKIAKLSETLLNYLVLVILLVIGIELGLVENLSQKIGDIARYLIILVILTVGSGLVSLGLYDKLFLKHRTDTRSHAKQSNIQIHGSLIQIACLSLGFVLAKFLPSQFLPPHQSITVLLMGLLLLVGISLKGSGIGIMQAMLNKQGLQISAIFTAFTLLSGVVFSLMFDDVSISQGLALASGFGWYSLSGTVMTDAYGAVWGSVALLNDLAREVLALLFIPLVMRISPSAAIGLGGVTSLDFTLPTLTQAGGVKIMPIIVSFGFITNIISPVLMVFFSSLG